MKYLCFQSEKFNSCNNTKKKVLPFSGNPGKSSQIVKECTNILKMFTNFTRIYVDWILKMETAQDIFFFAYFELNLILALENSFPKYGLKGSLNWKRAKNGVIYKLHTVLNIY